jgi:uncharacterized protein YabE (DUF348 family)
MRSHIIWIISALALFGGAFAAVSDVAPETASENTIRLPQITVLADGCEYGLATSAATVDEALGQLGLSLDPLDRVTPALTEAIADSQVIRITRVTRRELREEVFVPAKTVVLAEPDFPEGYTKVLSHGNDGRVRRVWRIWEKDGQESSRGLVKEDVLEKASDTVW